MRLVNIKPPHVALLLLAVGAGGHFLLSPENRRPFACLPCGVTAIVLGFGLILWVGALFRRRGTTVRPTERATSLVTSGPFRFSRNPMYLGMTFVLLGVALGVGSLPMLIAPVGFFGIMSVFRIPEEEQRLRKIFGDTYEDYTRRVRRWI